MVKSNGLKAGGGEMKLPLPIKFLDSKVGEEEVAEVLQEVLLGGGGGGGFRAEP